MDLFRHLDRTRLIQAGYQQEPDRKDGTTHWQTPDGQILIESEAIKHLARADYQQAKEDAQSQE